MNIDYWQLLTTKQGVAAINGTEQCLGGPDLCRKNLRSLYTGQNVKCLSKAAIYADE
jgi:hypothetical protein